jgi:hypothetical protein
VARCSEDAAGVGTTEPAWADTGVRAACAGAPAGRFAPDIPVLAAAEGGARVAAAWPVGDAARVQPAVTPAGRSDPPAEVAPAGPAEGPGDAAVGGAPAMTVAAATAKQTVLRMRVSRAEMGRTGIGSQIDHFG